MPRIASLHVARNMQFKDNIIIREGLRVLQRRLPKGWGVGEPELAPARSRVDALVELSAPDQCVVLLAIEAKTRLDPKAARALVEVLSAPSVPGPPVVIAPYLSESTRALLSGSEVGYLDLTGNIRLSVSRPGLFIEAPGAHVDPERENRPARSLKGAKAGRIVRALIDRKQPLGVRELAALTKIDAGYVSRVLTLLDTEALIRRVGHGRIQEVDWPALLKRWAQDAPLESRGHARTYLEPRGLSSFVARLAQSDARYAVTGSLAGATFAPTAPTRLATVWIQDAAEVASRLGLRAVDAGANLLLVEPGDEGVFEGSSQRDGVWYAAPSQVAADLLTSPGRGPAEGEALLGWMVANEEDWRR
ncbi:hypothetical protein EJ065_7014 [Corallococcus coralloides]|uniref:HTH iclR-type domain-containing protein n=1 Tax=Corallococcus coralloides TaxID=184914 RepID=A0A410S2X3_CORCK|nr:hypothetical protein EJ065_7014 [Corallococcus coralloides]